MENTNDIISWFRNISSSQKCEIFLFQRDDEDLYPTT